MRTTVTLDDDVAAKLKAEVRRTGKPFKVVLNEQLRVALSRTRRSGGTPAFRVAARDLGALRPGLSLDNVAEVVDLTEGPEAR